MTTKLHVTEHLSKPFGKWSIFSHHDMKYLSSNFYFASARYFSYFNTVYKELTTTVHIRHSMETLIYESAI